MDSTLGGRRALEMRLIGVVLGVASVPSFTYISLILKRQYLKGNPAHPEMSQEARTLTLTQHTHPLRVLGVAGDFSDLTQL